MIFNTLILKVICLPVLQKYFLTEVYEDKSAILIQTDITACNGNEIFSRNATPYCPISNVNKHFFHRIDYWIKPILSAKIKIQQNTNL